MKKETAVEELPCTMPRYMPGDIVNCKDGSIGVIVKSEVIINGSMVEWNQKLPDKIEHGGEPKYSLDRIPDYGYLSKSAWWTSSEFDQVILGNLHAIKPRESK